MSGYYWNTVTEQWEEEIEAPRGRNAPTAPVHSQGFGNGAGAGDYIGNPNNNINFGMAGSQNKSGPTVLTGPYGSNTTLLEPPTRPATSSFSNANSGNYTNAPPLHTDLATSGIPSGGFSNHMDAPLHKADPFASSMSNRGSLGSPNAPPPNAGPITLDTPRFHSSSYFNASPLNDSPTALNTLGGSTNNHENTTTPNANLTTPHTRNDDSDSHMRTPIPGPHPTSSNISDDKSKDPGNLMLPPPRPTRTDRARVGETLADLNFSNPSSANVQNSRVDYNFRTALEDPNTSCMPDKETTVNTRPLRPKLAPVSPSGNSFDPKTSPAIPPTATMPSSRIFLHSEHTRYISITDAPSKIPQVFIGGPTYDKWVSSSRTNTGKELLVVRDTDLNMPFYEALGFEMISYVTLQTTLQIKRYTCFTIPRTSNQVESTHVLVVPHLQQVDSVADTALMLGGTENTRVREYNIETSCLTRILRDPDGTHEWIIANELRRSIPETGNLVAGNVEGSPTAETQGL